MVSREEVLKSVGITYKGRNLHVEEFILQNAFESIQSSLSPRNKSMRIKDHFSLIRTTVILNEDTHLGL